MANIHVLTSALEALAARGGKASLESLAGALGMTQDRLRGYLELPIGGAPLFRVLPIRKGDRAYGLASRLALRLAALGATLPGNGASQEKKQVVLTAGGAMVANSLLPQVRARRSKAIRLLMWLTLSRTPPSARRRAAASAAAATLAATAAAFSAPPIAAAALAPAAFLSALLALAE